MAGIYIHIPFCRQACHYCNFHFATSLRYKNEMIDALLKETGLRKEYIGAETVETIYLGGGTPSLLGSNEINSIIHACRNNFNILPTAEITLEANPDDITEERLSEWKDIGINRLSIGVQSFFEEDLVWMNRAHNAQQALDHLQLALRYFDNITIDLIYGSPGLTNEKWEHNVQTAINLGIPHLSCYALTVEPKTLLEKMILQHRSADTDPGMQSEQFLLLMQWMEEAGYEHYEISNFAKPGWRSRHNTSYWQGKKYLGIGPSAHSFDHGSRQWNVANNNQYIQALQNGQLLFEKEELTRVQQLNEYIMTSLRTLEGLQLEKVDREAASVLADGAKKYVESGKMVLIKQALVLTKEGRLLADGIAADLFFTEE